MIRERLIAYVVGGILTAGVTWWVAHQVSQWHDAFRERPVLLQRIKDGDSIRKKVEANLLDQAARNRQIEATFNENLVRAGNNARALADSLLSYQVRAGRFERAAAVAASDRDAARQESDHWREVAEAAREHFAACSDDAVALTAAQEYIRGLPRRCLPD